MVVVSLSPSSRTSVPVPLKNVLYYSVFLYFRRYIKIDLQNFVHHLFSSFLDWRIPIFANNSFLLACFSWNFHFSFRIYLKRHIISNRFILFKMIKFRNIFLTFFEVLSSFIHLNFYPMCFPCKCLSNLC